MCIMCTKCVVAEIDLNMDINFFQLKKWFHKICRFIGNLIINICEVIQTLQLYVLTSNACDFNKVVNWNEIAPYHIIWTRLKQFIVYINYWKWSNCSITYILDNCYQYDNCKCWKCNEMYTPNSLNFGNEFTLLIKEIIRHHISNWIKKPIGIHLGKFI
jgi:hypothetical protein